MTSPEVIIEVSALEDTEDVSFSAIRMRHGNCNEKSELRKHRNVIDNSYELECSCGLKVLLPMDSNAQQLFKLVSIDSMERELGVDTFQCSAAAKVIVRARIGVNPSSHG